MRIGYIVTDYPPLTETFIRREVQGLCRAGERVFLYTHTLSQDPLVPDLDEPNLTVRAVPFLRDPASLVRQAEEDGIEHLHASLMLVAHRRAWETARSLGISFSLTAYSGHDIFTASDPRLYHAITTDPLCAALIVEDPFMQSWVTERLGANQEKIVILPNSFDMSVYRRTEPYPAAEPLVILAIARFVKKKGLVHLVRAFNQLCSQRFGAELWLVGSGIEEPVLRRAAKANPRVKFLGRVSEAETRQLYQQASIFCLPVVQAPDGDADGVPTTVLEALAFELPVVSSNLFSMPYYVRDEQDGILVPPGDENALTQALERLCADRELRQQLGHSGRQRIQELCSLDQNLQRLLALLHQARLRLWQEKLQAVDQHRRAVTAEKEAYYIERRTRAMKYFQPAGRLLEIGCGDGYLRRHLPAGVTYFGCDPLPLQANSDPFPFVAAVGEALPFRSESFDSVVLYAVLAHVYEVDAVLTETRRLLRPGGCLYVQECYNDPNPIHLNHFSASSLCRRVGYFFEVLASQPANEYLMMIKARKPDVAPPKKLMSTAIAPLTIEKTGASPASAPLVSVVITAYNRSAFLRTCIDSVLNQTYRPIEIIVIDDGSTDDTRSLLESYGEVLRTVHNNQNRGRAFSKNLGLRLTSPQARYVAILDSDDAYLPQFIEHCVQYLEGHPEHGLVYTDDILIDEHGREIRRRPAVHPWSLDNWLRTRNLRGDTWLARRELVMQTRLHDETLDLDEDYDLFYQLLEITSFGHVLEYLVYIRQNNSRSKNEILELAKCHAANLVKYGFSPEYAYLRARQNPEWIPYIEEGIAIGRHLKEKFGTKP